MRTFPYNLRFPGQYYQAETGLNQNWNRDYDPLIGKYVESDPLGLISGVDTYAYALDMPTMNYDQKGLEAVSYLLHHGPKPPPVPCGCTARLPDFLQFQIDLYVISIAGSYTKYGDVFAGGGMNRGYPNPASIGVSIVDGWLLQCDPTPQQLNDYLRGFSWGGSGFWGFGGGLNHNGSGTALTLGVGVGYQVGSVGNSQRGNIAGGQ